MLSSALKTALKAKIQATAPHTQLTILTGAGISAESGIPTFRGEEGYWQVGSTVYQPQEIATRAMFNRSPEVVWQWYLYRRGICRQAEPNAGHLALWHLEQAYGDRFRLITQNVDGLHLRVGHAPARVYQVHGNTDQMRCLNDACPGGVQAIPLNMPPKAKDTPFLPSDWQYLTCATCGQRTRPHVLWFDETYNEAWYSFNSALQRARASHIFISVGTSGATTLPLYAALDASETEALMIDINLESNPLTEIALEAEGFFIAAASSTALPAIAEILL